MSLTIVKTVQIDFDHCNTVLYLIVKCCEGVVFYVH